MGEHEAPDMTSNDRPGVVGRALAWLRAKIPATARETWYRVSSGAVMFLFAFGTLAQDSVTLWIQLVGATVTLLFAALYSTSTLRTVLYTTLAPAGAVLMYYGIVSDVRWALITAAVAQVFGIATAAAKSVQAPKG